MQIVEKGTKTPQEAEFSEDRHEGAQVQLARNPFRGVVSSDRTSTAFVLDAKDEKSRRVTRGSTSIEPQRRPDRPKADRVRGRNE